MKYKNHKVTYDGITFDSKRECNRYIELKELQKAGKIYSLELQKPFELIPGCSIKENGIRTERACKYIADFVYIVKYKDDNGDERAELVVEDTKGMRTPDYVIKRKLMYYRYKIAIHEI